MLKKRVNLPATSQQKEFKNFLNQIKEQQKNIDTAWFKNEFNYETSNKIQLMTIIKQHPLLKKVLQILRMWLKICQKVMQKTRE